ncbi:MAG TPA: hypothetical protein VE132_00410, partial [Micromonosporaceae bacterium]|nr:hypothetical protein [Micromonosporaceae bacterium]
FATTITRMSAPVFAAATQLAYRLAGMRRLQSVVSAAITRVRSYWAGVGVGAVGVGVPVGDGR